MKIDSGLQLHNLQLHNSHREILYKNIYVQINKYCVHMCKRM